MASWLDWFAPKRAPEPQGPDWPPPAMPRRPWLVLVVGRRGYGKTYYCNRVMDAWPADAGLRYAIDPVAPDDASHPRFPEYIAGHSDLWSHDAPARARFEYGKIGLLVVDEADRFLPTAQGHRDGLLSDLVLRGRHRGVSLLLATQRPALVAYDARSQADRIVTYRLTADNDLDSLIAVAPDLKTYRAQIQQLPVGRAIVWDSKHGVYAKNAA